MEAYLALATCIALMALAAVVTTAVIQGERIRHLESVASRRADERLAMVDLVRRLTVENDKLREAIRPFDRDGDGRPGGANLDPYVKRALDRANG